MRPALGLDRPDLLEPVTVKAADKARVTDGDVEAALLGVVHEDVGQAGSGSLSTTSPLSASNMTSARPSAAQNSRPASSQSPCGPALGTGRGRSIDSRSASMTVISAGSRMFA